MNKQEELKKIEDYWKDKPEHKDDWYLKNKRKLDRMRYRQLKREIENSSYKLALEIFNE